MSDERERTDERETDESSDKTTVDGYSRIHRGEANVRPTNRPTHVSGLSACLNYLHLLYIFYLLSAVIYSLICIALEADKIQRKLAAPTHHELALTVSDIAVSVCLIFYLLDILSLLHSIWLT